MRFVHVRLGPLGPLLILPVDPDTGEATITAEALADVWDRGRRAVHTRGPELAGHVVRTFLEQLRRP